MVQMVQWRLPHIGCLDVLPKSSFTEAILTFLIVGVIYSIILFFSYKKNDGIDKETKEG